MAAVVSPVQAIAANAGESERERSLTQANQRGPVNERDQKQCQNRHSRQNHASNRLQRPFEKF